MRSGSIVPSSKALSVVYLALGAIAILDAIWQTTSAGHVIVVPMVIGVVGIFAVVLGTVGLVSRRPHS